MSCLLSVVAYMRRREKTLMPKVSLDNFVKRLHMDLVSFTRNLSIFLMSGSEKGPMLNVYPILGWLTLFNIIISYVILIL